MFSLAVFECRNYANGVPEPSLFILMARGDDYRRDKLVTYAEKSQYYFYLFIIFMRGSTEGIDYPHSC